MRRLVPVLLAGLVAGTAGSASADLPCERFGTEPVRRVCQAVDPTPICSAILHACVDPPPICSAILQVCVGE